MQNRKASLTERVPYFKVQAIRVNDIIINNLDIHATLLRAGQVLDELSQLGSANTVRAVHGQGALDLDTTHNSLESFGKLLIVALLCGLSILILGAQGVLAAHNIVELRGGHVLQIEEFDLRSGKGGVDDRDQTRARGTSVASEDDTSWVLHADINLLDEFVKDIANLVKRGVGKSGGICFPLSLHRCEKVVAFQYLAALGAYLQHFTL